MIYLEKRQYSRDELACYLGISANDKNFKRKVITRLSNLGYQEEDYLYTTKTITFLRQPATHLEKITYLVRLLGIDKQVNPHLFSLFLYCFVYDEDYNCMPWEERANLLNYNFNVSVNEKTLRNWTNKLLAFGEVVRDKSQFVIWCSYRVDNSIYRSPVDEDNQTYQDYTRRRKELFEQNGNQWNGVFETLWKEYHCKFYKCYKFSFNAWHSSEIIEELFLLVRQYVDDRYK